MQFIVTLEGKDARILMEGREHSTEICGIWMTV
jgi:hypothetical protein